MLLVSDRHFLTLIFFAISRSEFGSAVYTALHPTSAPREPKILQVVSVHPPRLTRMRGFLFKLCHDLRMELRAQWRKTVARRGNGPDVSGRSKWKGDGDAAALVFHSVWSEPVPTSVRPVQFGSVSVFRPNRNWLASQKSNRFG